jgi:protein transport protein SEC61 subunit gamma-like protein
MNINGVRMNIKNYFGRIRRVLLVASKPDKAEFTLSAKVTGIGMAIIGVVGFIIFIIFTLMGAM